MIANVVAYKHIGVATTRTTYSDGKIEIQYHSTVVASRSANGSVTLKAGGWRTQTTKKRINAALDEWFPGWRVYQIDWEWYLGHAQLGHEVTFKDGIRIEDMGVSWLISHNGMGSYFPKESNDKETQAS